ncbi:MAG: efflux RND transporter periplasmic adaptor subunit [Kiritimatiellales bacterium]|nr:efflux RND transporter periplasmic adaptor subunit [Kiritimatiellales bacterium]
MKRILLITVSILALSGCAKEKPTGVPVVVIPAAEASLPQNLLLTGTLEPYRISPIASRINGRILSILVDEGERVDAGALLVSLDPLVESVAVYGIQGNLAQARNNLEAIDALYRERIESSMQQLQTLRETTTKQVAVSETQYGTGERDLARQSQATLTQIAITLEGAYDTADMLLGISEKYKDPGMRNLLDQHIGVFAPTTVEDARNKLFDTTTSLKAFRTHFDANILDGEASAAALSKSLSLAETSLNDMKSTLEKIHIVLSSSVTSPSFSDSKLSEWKEKIFTQGNMIETSLAAVRTQKSRGSLATPVDVLEKSSDLATAQAYAQVEQTEFALDVLKKERDAKLAEAQAMITRLQAEAGISAAQLSQTSIKAPFSGIIVQKHAEEGEVVHPGAPLLTIADDHAFTITIGVSDAHVGSLILGREAQVTIDSLPDKPFKATITKVASSADPVSKKIYVKLTLAETEEILKSGMFARVIFAFAESEGVIVPMSALISRYGKHMIFVEQDGIALQRFVEIGTHSDQFVSITSGVDVGENVIVKGNLYLRDGDSVSIIETKEEEPEKSGSGTLHSPQTLTDV